MNLSSSISLEIMKPTEIPSLSFILKVILTKFVRSLNDVNNSPAFNPCADLLFLSIIPIVIEFTLNRNFSVIHLNSEGGSGQLTQMCLDH